MEQGSGRYTPLQGYTKPYNTPPSTYAHKTSKKIETQLHKETENIK
jgi:hypothetical protein